MRTFRLAFLLGALPLLQSASCAVGTWHRETPAMFLFPFGFLLWSWGYRYVRAPQKRRRAFGAGLVVSLATPVGLVLLYWLLRTWTDTCFDCADPPLVQWVMNALLLGIILGIGLTAYCMGVDSAREAKKRIPQGGAGSGIL